MFDDRLSKYVSFCSTHTFFVEKRSCISAGQQLCLGHSCVCAKLICVCSFQLFTLTYYILEVSYSSEHFVNFIDKISFPPPQHIPCLEKEWQSWSFPALSLSWIYGLSLYHLYNIRDLLTCRWKMQWLFYSQEVKIHIVLIQYTEIIEFSYWSHLMKILTYYLWRSCDNCIY